MILLLMLGLILPAQATLNSEIIINQKEICPDVIKIEVLVNNAYIDTYYEYHEGTNWFECAIHTHGLIDPLDDYPR
jgi:hypothetical protein